MYHDNNNNNNNAKNNINAIIITIIMIVRKCIIMIVGKCSSSKNAFFCSPHNKPVTGQVSQCTLLLLKCLQPIHS